MFFSLVMAIDECKITNKNHVKRDLPPTFSLSEMCWKSVGKSRKNLGYPWNSFGEFLGKFRIRGGWFG